MTADPTIETKMTFADQIVSTTLLAPITVTSTVECPALHSATATKFHGPHLINGISFDGSADITVPAALSSMILIDDWQTGGIAGFMGWDTAQNNGAALWNTALQSATVRGILELRANNGNAGNRATASLWNSGLPFLMGRGIGFVMRIRLEALGDGTNPYRIRVGFGDIIPSNSTTDQDNGFYFEYDYAQSANWRCKTAAAASRTTSTSTIAVTASTWIKLEARANAANTAVDFSVDDVLAATVSGTLPTAVGDDFAPLISITRHTANGNAQRSLYIDAYAAAYTSNT